MDSTSSMTTVLEGATLDGFARRVGKSGGVHVDALEPLTALVVETRNSVYRIIVSKRSAVLVQGGRFFPQPTQVHLSGSGLGGSLLKLGWIGVGYRMEVNTGGQRIVTSPVCKITRDTTSASVH